MTSLIVKFLLLISLDLIKSLKIQAYYLFCDWFQTARMEPWQCGSVQTGDTLDAGDLRFLGHFAGVSRAMWEG